MLIFGHKLIEVPKFHLINSENASFKEGINCFEYNENLIEKALKEGVKFAILAKNEDEILFANALKAEFILLENENLAKKASKMAEFYLFDSKVLFIIDRLKNLRNTYKIGIDGVILREIIKQA